MPNDLNQLGLKPIIRGGGPPLSPFAVWVGTIDDDDPRLCGSGRLELIDGAGYAQARLLVRHGRAVRGSVTVPIVDATLDLAQLHCQIADLPPAMAVPALSPGPPITVVLCTRDRAEYLENALTSLLQLDYADFEVLVIDNASRTDAAQDYVRSLADPRVRLALEPKPGLSRARNRALLEARHAIVAFTDDDVIVDSGWLHGLAAGFASAPNVGVVCGAVSSAELRSAAQLYFESRIAWADSRRSAIWDRRHPPADVPLFPFEVGRYGTGANFAIDRELAIRLGGFNEALGAGSPTGGGEDIDMFVRALFADVALVTVSDAIVWHRHRDDLDSLARQLSSYGHGMGAWITAVLLGTGTRREALRLIGRATRRIPTLGQAQHAPGPAAMTTSASLRRREVLGMAIGPLLYARARAGGRRSRPLA